jgi:hypothetical protein
LLSLTFDLSLFSLSLSLFSLFLCRCLSFSFYLHPFVLLSLSFPFSSSLHFFPRFRKLALEQTSNIPPRTEARPPRPNHRHAHLPRDFKRKDQNGIPPSYS